MRKSWVRDEGKYCDLLAITPVLIEKYTSSVVVLKSGVLVPSTKDQSDDPQIEEAQRCQ